MVTNRKTEKQAVSNTEVKNETVNQEAVEKEPIEKQEEVKETKTVTKKASRPSLDKNETITIVSRTRGKLVYVSPAGYKYVWDNYGDEQELEYSEVKDMSSSSKSFFPKGWVEILDNEDAVSHFRVDKFVDNAYTEEDLENLFEGPAEDIIEILEADSNVNTRRAIFDFARKEFVEGRLRDYDTIQKLSDAFKMPIDPNK